MEWILETHSGISFNSSYMALPGTGRYTFQFWTTAGPGGCHGGFFVLRLLIIGLAGLCLLSGCAKTGMTGGWGAFEALNSRAFQFASGFAFI